jgi:uncharacterized protein YpmS
MNGTYKFFPYIILLIFSFIILLSVAVYGLQYRDKTPFEEAQKAYNTLG